MITEYPNFFDRQTFLLHHSLLLLIIQFSALSPLHYSLISSFPSNSSTFLPHGFLCIFTCYISVVRYVSLSFNVSRLRSIRSVSYTHLLGSRKQSFPCVLDEDPLWMVQCGKPLCSGQCLSLIHI